MSLTTRRQLKNVVNARLQRRKLLRTGSARQRRKRRFDGDGGDYGKSKRPRGQKRRSEDSDATRNNRVKRRCEIPASPVQVAIAPIGFIRLMDVNI